MILLDKISTQRLVGILRKNQRKIRGIFRDEDLSENEMKMVEAYGVENVKIKEILSTRGHILKGKTGRQQKMKEKRCK